MLNPAAERYNRLTYIEVLQKRLKIMDSAAISLCMENRIPVIVFNLFEKGNLTKIATGNGRCTILSDTADAG